MSTSMPNDPPERCFNGHPLVYPNVSGKKCVLCSKASHERRRIRMYGPEKRVSPWRGNNLYYMKADHTIIR